MHSPGRPPFRADHVGSLLRPAELRQAFRRHAAGEIGDVEFERALRISASAMWCAMQEEVGLQVVTDGEFRRGSYWGRFVERTAGFEIRDALVQVPRRPRATRSISPRPMRPGKLKRLQPLALDEFAFLHGATKVTAKITLPAPSTMHFYRCTDFADPGVYPDARRPSSPISRHSSEQEIADLAEAGCRYIQLDEVAVAMLCDPAIRARSRARASDPDALVDLYIDAHQRRRRACPPDMVDRRAHVPRQLQGSLPLRGRLRVGGRALLRGAPTSITSCSNTTPPRAGDFAPLRFVPKSKGVVLGLVSTKTPVLESLDLLKRRVDEATRTSISTGWRSARNAALPAPLPAIR